MKAFVVFSLTLFCVTSVHHLANGQHSIVKRSLNDDATNISYPGTKWCGPGDTASNYDDLGVHREEDECCRTHDYCDYIAAGETKYNLTNKNYAAVLNCECDKELFNCLHSINSDLSNRIGVMYFAFQKQCYREDYPIIECINYDKALLMLKRCREYKLDENESVQYQWFDLPFYNSQAFNWNV